MARVLLTTIVCLLFAAHFAVAAVPTCGAGKQDFAVQDATIQALVCIDEAAQQDDAPVANAEHAKPCHDHLGYFRRLAEPPMGVTSSIRLTTAGRNIHPVSQEIVLPPPQ